MKKFVIEGILKNSILDEMKVKPGDKLLSINQEMIMDVLDYRYLMADEELLIEIEKPSGEIWELEIEKEFEEDLGILFTQEMIKTKTCKNNCVFCFIDQLPQGMRESLYVKDDDERLSFLIGNYITMTNLTKTELDRIIRYRIMPMNLSIHTTDPKLRCQLLNNRFAGDVMTYLELFKENNILMNGQIVLVPGYNDGDALVKTLKDLKDFYPTLQCVSVVPVGLSNYREGLVSLEGFTKKTATESLAIIERVHQEMQEIHGEGFVYPSDEFFLMAEKPLPQASYYDGFPQIENGVGMMADFIDSFETAMSMRESEKTKEFPKIGIITGLAAKKMMTGLIQALKLKHPKINVAIYPIVNDFFGEKINVSGLLTGRDMIKQIGVKIKENPRDLLLIPENMLRRNTDTLLDDHSLKTVSAALKTKVISVPIHGEALIKIIMKEDA